MRRCLALVMLLSCASPALAQTFTEEAAARGLTAVTSFGFGGPIFGYGIALNDLDGDGDPDCIVTGAGVGEVLVYENDGTGNFTDQTTGSGMPVSLDYNGVSCADYDGDGDLDVYLTGREIANVLLRNDGGFSFVDVTVAAGVGDTGEGAGACWADFDNDGDVDLYVVNYAPNAITGSDTINALYQNDGDGTFSEVGAAYGVDDEHAGFHAVFFDHDLDGDQDLYLANDFGDGVGDNRNRLWRNDDGQFVDVSEVSGAGVGLDAMGVSVGDLNRDGFFDLYVSDNPPANLLLLNDGDGTYTDSSDLAGVTGTGGRGWGNALLDVDNDGWLEIYNAFSASSNALYDWAGTFPMVDVASSAGIDDAMYSPPGSSFCCAYADVDLDGDLDVLVQSWNEPLGLFINADGNDKDWLRVRLSGSGSNTFAIGAGVVVRCGSDVQTGHIVSGTGYKSSSELVAHFGLDAATIVDAVLVRWPDKSLSVLENLGTNRVVLIDQSTTLTEPDCDGNLIPDLWQIAADSSLDADGDGVLDSCGSSPTFRRGDANLDNLSDLGDAVTILAHVFAGGAAECLDAADVNDDGGVDVADPVFLLSHLFGSGPPSPPPGPVDCGVDPTADSGVDLGCVTSCL